VTLGSSRTSSRASACRAYIAMATASPSRSTGSSTPVEATAGTTVARSAAPKAPTDGTPVFETPMTKAASSPTTTTRGLGSTPGR